MVRSLKTARCPPAAFGKLERQERGELEPTPVGQFPATTGRSRLVTSTLWQSSNPGYAVVSIGIKYRELLARSGIDLEVRLTNGALENIKLLNGSTSGVLSYLTI